MNYDYILMFFWLLIIVFVLGAEKEAKEEGRKEP